MSGWGGCLARIFVLLLFGLVVLAVIGGSALLISYYRIANTLPSVDGLKDSASQFETTRILDRNGSLLYEILEPNAGRRTFVPLDRISPALIAATIATEDQDFYTHPGFDPMAIIRALWVNYRTEGQGGGASTITQQLARALLLSPEERAERTYRRKAREIILAAEITRRYSKDEILELYLNEIYYGNLAYGIEAAAETYFGKTANQLSLAEASFLAGLPQSPAVYDIYTNREATLIRQQQVLVLMFGLSQQRGCITVSNLENTRHTSCPTWDTKCASPCFAGFSVHLYVLRRTTHAAAMKAEPFQKLAEATGLRYNPPQEWPAAPSPSGENAIVSNGLQTGRLSLTWLRDSLRALFAAFLMAGLVGCRSTPPAPAESSVKPDVNAEFLKPDLQVTQWLERFERGGREIYDQREAITQAIGLRPGMRVADIGAGTGLFTPLFFAQAVGPRGIVYAVDIAPDFVKHIEQISS